MQPAGFTVWSEVGRKDVEGVYTADPKKVSIVQGSGSGHEPAHVMIVGKGMLDGACQGLADWLKAAAPRIEPGSLIDRDRPLGSEPFGQLGAMLGTDTVFLDRVDTAARQAYVERVSRS